MGKKAFDATRISGYAMDPNDLVVVGIDTEHKRGEHPLWDERCFYPLEEAMVLNIMRLGVKEPVIVTKDGDKPLVVDGRRRTLHAREANRRLREAGETECSVPVLLDKGSDNYLEEVAISMNEHRLQDAYMVKVDKAMRMLGRNQDAAAVAITFGVDVQTVKNWEKLVSVSPKVRKAIDAGLVAPTAAVKLADLSRDEQESELEKLLAAGPVTVATATHAARQNKRKKNGDGDEVLVPPGKRVIKKVVEFFAEAELDEQFIRGVRWVIGDLSPSAVKGLQGLINDIEAKKAREKKASKSK